MKFPSSQDPSQIALLEHSVEGASEYNLLVELIINTGAYSYETLYQSDLVGWAGLFVSIVGTSILCSKHPRIALVLLLALAARTVSPFYIITSFRYPMGQAMQTSLIYMRSGTRRRELHS